jgi:hypothetical protein
MSKLLSFFGVSPYQLMVIGGLLVGAFFVGAAWNNHAATVAAVEAVQRAADTRADNDRKAYAAALVKAKDDWAKQRETERAAEKAGKDQLVAAKARADADYKAALIKLSQLEKGDANGAFPLDTIVVGGPDLRRLLNDTAAACTNAGSLPAASGVVAGFDDRAAACSSDSAVTLGQLKAALLVRSREYREVSGHLAALQTNAKRLGLAPAGVSPPADK